MNKYQEALNYFCDHCMEYEDDYDWEENPCGEYVKVDEEILKEKKDILQELVDKATPKKPNMEQEAITEQEKEFLKMISTEFKYIARDEDGSLYLYRKKPRKGADMWFEMQARLISGMNKNVLKGIRWEDEEPFCIDDHVKRKEEENEE